MLKAEFEEFLTKTLRGYPFSIKSGFLVFDDGNGRTLLIDLFTGDLHAQPTVPHESFIQEMQATQCVTCYHHSSPEAIVNCMRYLSDGFFHPTRICVVTDDSSSRQIYQTISLSDRDMFNQALTPVQLKALATFIAFQEKLVPADIQEKVDAIPAMQSLMGGNCPFYERTVDMKRRLINRNILRYKRRQRFLDLLKVWNLILPSHHVLGSSYYDRKIMELEAVLARVDQN